MTINHPGTTMPSDRQPTADPRSTSASGDHGSAKEKARDVGGHAQQAGQHVAHTAVEQGRETVAEAGRQARDLFGEARSELRGQAGEQQRRAAGGLRSLAGEMRSMADRSEQSGPVSELARQGADRINGVAGWLEQREPGDLLDQVRGYARRSPGTFLLGAALLGVVTGRLTRGATSGDGQTSGPASPQGAGGAATGGYRSDQSGHSAGQSGYPTPVDEGLYSSSAAAAPTDPSYLASELPTEGGRA